MKSITLHNIDDAVYFKIKQLAQEQKKSLNKTIKGIIRQFLGYPSSTKTVYHHDDFKEFLGAWSKKETQLFNKTIQKERTIDPQDWV